MAMTRRGFIGRVFGATVAAGVVSTRPPGRVKKAAVAGGFKNDIITVHGNPFSCDNNCQINTMYMVDPKHFAYYAIKT